ncbi:MAG: heavy-metal-associated domain-containing protein [Thermoplasmatales archaeon]|jgi:copper chaperone|nr:heavy-metal-associated domain-containing protein [Thermoplasmatales archaeon]
MFGSKSVTLKVSGMTCGHCEARVVKAASSVEGVKSAKASSSKGTVAVKGDMTPETIEKVKTAINEAGYPVTD